MILAVRVSLEVLGLVVESSGDNPKVEKQIQLNSFLIFFWLDDPKIIRENTFEQKKKKPGLKFNLEKLGSYL